VGVATPVTLVYGFNYFQVPISSPSVAQQYYISASGSALSSPYYYFNAFGIATALPASDFPAISLTTQYAPRVSSGTMSVLVINTNSGSSSISATFTVMASAAPACAVLPYTSVACPLATYITIPHASTDLLGDVAKLALSVGLTGCALKEFTDQYCTVTYPMCDSNNFVLPFCSSFCSDYTGCSLTVSVAADGVAQTNTFASVSQCQQSMQSGGDGFFTATTNCNRYYSSASTLLPKVWVFGLVAISLLFGLLV